MKRSKFSDQQIAFILRQAQEGTPLAADAWFRSEPLPGFGNQTADQLVRDGKAALVMPILIASWLAASLEEIEICLKKMINAPSVAGLPLRKPFTCKSLQETL